MAIHIRPVHAAIYQRLAGDSTLTALATGGVHRSVAPAGTQHPYVVFFLQDAPERPTFDGPGGVPGSETSARMVYVVKGVDRGLSDERAAAAYERAHELLIGDDAETALNAVLAAAGMRVLGVQREGLIAYDEDETETQIQHVGGIYALIVQGVVA